MRVPTALTEITRQIAQYRFTGLAYGDDASDEAVTVWATRQNEGGWTYEYPAGTNRAVRVEHVHCTPAELAQALTASERVMDTDPELLGAACASCGAPISGHAARYRGVTRCRSCAAKTRATSESGRAQASAAANAKHQRDAENKRLADRARAQGVG